MNKDTRTDLVAELQKIEPKTDLIHLLIKEAKEGEFHDYKNRKYDLPKIVLANLLREDARLYSLREAVIRGEYDERADEEDKQNMRDELPKEMWGLLGL